MDVFTYYETNIYIRENMEHKNDYKKRKAGCLNKYFNLGTIWKESPRERGTSTAAHKHKLCSHNQNSLTYALKLQNGHSHLEKFILARVKLTLKISVLNLA